MSHAYIYLASPYSHDDPAIRHERYYQAHKAILLIADQRVPVYSPIVHWHTAAVEAKLPTDHEFWKVQNDSMMYQCGEIWILTIDGWRQSKGVEYEINFATTHGIKVRHVSFESIVETVDLFKHASR